MSFNDGEDWVDVNENWLGVIENNNSTRKVSSRVESQSSNNMRGDDDTTSSKNILDDEEFCLLDTNMFVANLESTNVDNVEKTEEDDKMATAVSDKKSSEDVKPTSTVKLNNNNNKSSNTQQHKATKQKVDPPEDRILAAAKAVPAVKAKTTVIPLRKCRELEKAMLRATENLAESLNRAFIDFAGDTLPPYQRRKKPMVKKLRRKVPT